MLFLLLLLHPVHATFAEIEFNADTRRVEVALRLDGLDEQAIEKPFGAKDAKMLEAARLKYLAKHFRFDVVGDDGDGDSVETKPEPKRYRWVGREVKGASVWWYFEVEVEAETEGGRRPEKLRQTMLFDVDDRFTHAVRCLRQTDPVIIPETTLNFTSQKSTQDLPRPPQ